MQEELDPDYTDNDTDSTRDSTTSSEASPSPAVGRRRGRKKDTISTARWKNLKTKKVYMDARGQQYHWNPVTRELNETLDWSEIVHGYSMFCGDDEPLHVPTFDEEYGDVKVYMIPTPVKTETAKRPAQPTKPRKPKKPRQA